jgi:Tfp pilus assembly protein PilF
MKSQSHFRRAASLVMSAGLIVLPGCSSIGSRVANLSSPKKADSQPVTLGKIQSDHIGRPVPGSQAPMPPVLDTPHPQTAPETRSNVALAMGDMLERSNNLTGARDQFEQALKSDPKSLKAALALARIEARLGRPDAALRIYQDAEKQHRRSAAIVNDKGLLLAEQQDWNAAIAALRTAVKLEPKESRYHNNLGMVLASSGAYDDAWKEFREAVGPGPAHYNIALMHLQAGHSVEARNHAERALAAMPKLKEAQELLAQIDAESPSGTLSATEPDVNMELENVNEMNIDDQPVGDVIEARGNEVIEDSNVAPASATEPVANEPPANSEPPAAVPDPWSKRWVPPKWLR